MQAPCTTFRTANGVPIYPFDTLALVQELENETYLCEALLFPELCRYEDRPHKARENLQNSLPRFLTELPPTQLQGRRQPHSVELRKLELSLAPAKRSRTWSEPVPLTVHAVCWQQGGACHAFVPALTIEVVADSEEELEEVLTRNVRAALQRSKASASLKGLMMEQRVKEVKLEPIQVNLDVMTTRQRVEANNREPEKASVLSEVATRLAGKKLPQAYEVEEQVARLARLLTGKSARSVLLVGPSGVGKSALCYELVRQRRHHRLGQTAFWETTGSRLMVGADSFGDWQQRCRSLCVEASKERVVLMLGNLFELAEVGRSGSSPQGIAGFMRPFIERGDLLVVVECTPEQRDAMERDHGHLLQSFATLEFERPEPRKVASILLSVAEPRVSLEAIEGIESLHRRFASYSACPGRPLRFLRELMADREGELGAPEVCQAFSEDSGMPRFMIDDEIALDLSQTQDFFSRRILGQPEAVQLVVDLLASVKAGLSPPGRPIASLLFIGPTGVGKTEMARTLAEFLFQDRQRMARFDMSEFSDPYSVARLTSGSGGGQGLLTSKVREQPFGVVLFDELEKADPAFFDLLLQILGEGRLTDARGEVADFTNSLVVMTSNLGAASFSKGPMGFRTAQAERSEHARQQFTSAVKAAFRPELFNRIDRLVPFAPLDRETARQVAKRELAALCDRDGIKHGNLTLEIESGVAEHLAQLGYDHKYGARPLKRAIEKLLLAPLSALTNELSGKPRVARVSLGEEQLAIALEEPPEAKRADRSVPQRALSARRRASRLGACSYAHELRNRIHRLERLKARHSRRSYAPPDEAQRVGQLPRYQRLQSDMEELEQRARDLETAALLGFQGYQEQRAEIRLELNELERDLKRLMLRLYTQAFEQPDRATVLVYRGKCTLHQILARGYAEVFQKLGYEYTSYRLTLGSQQPPPTLDTILRLPYGLEVEDRALHCEPANLSDCLSQDLVGLALEVEGDLALPTLLGEAGLHLFNASGQQRCKVVVLSEALEDYQPPEGLHLQRDLTGPKRRTYLRESSYVEDHVLDRRYHWSGKDLTGILTESMPATLESAAEKACR